MMALRDHLRAEEHCPVRLGEPRQPFRQLGRVRGNVRVEADELEPGKTFRQLLFEPLVPAPSRAGSAAPQAGQRVGLRLSPPHGGGGRCAVPVQLECDVAGSGSGRSPRRRGSGGPARSRAGSGGGWPCRLRPRSRRAPRGAVRRADIPPRGEDPRPGRAAAAGRAARPARAARAAPSSRVAASRFRRPRPRLPGRRASPRRCARRSGGRTPAYQEASCSCRRRSGRVSPPARRQQTGLPRRRTPRRRRFAPARRAAPHRSSPSGERRPGRGSGP